MTQIMPPESGQYLPDEQRRAALQYHVAGCVSHGWRVETVLSPYDVVIVCGKNPNHVLHAILSLFTLGFWLPIWLIVALTAKETRATRHVTEYGQVIDL